MLLVVVMGGMLVCGGLSGIVVVSGHGITSLLLLLPQIRDGMAEEEVGGWMNWWSSNVSAISHSPPNFDVDCPRKLRAY